MPADALLDAIARAAAALEADPSEQARRLAYDLRAYISGTTRADWQRIARQQRNTALRRAATVRYANIEPGRRARLLSSALTRYHAGGWMTDRTRTTDPYEAGTFGSFLWQTLKALPKPVSAKQVRRILDMP